MKNDFVFFYSFGAPSQFVNLIKYINTVVWFVEGWGERGKNDIV